MTKTEVKKALYKQKPTAVIFGTRNGDLEYKATVHNEQGYGHNVYFKVPPEEAETLKDMEPAQLLIRWMI